MSDVNVHSLIRIAIESYRSSLPFCSVAAAFYFRNNGVTKKNWEIYLCLLQSSFPKKMPVPIDYEWQSLLKCVFLAPSLWPMVSASQTWSPPWCQQIWPFSSLIQQVIEEEVLVPFLLCLKWKWSKIWSDIGLTYYS